MGEQRDKSERDCRASEVGKLNNFRNFGAYEKKELIKRSISKEDRRFIQVVLTEKGASLKEDVLATVEQVNTEVMSVFSDEERESLKSYLRTLAGVSV